MTAPFSWITREADKKNNYSVPPDYVLCHCLSLDVVDEVAMVISANTLHNKLALQ